MRGAGTFKVVHMAIESVDSLRRVSPDAFIRGNKNYDNNNTRIMCGLRNLELLIETGWNVFV